MVRVIPQATTRRPEGSAVSSPADAARAASAPPIDVGPAPPARGSDDAYEIAAPTTRDEGTSSASVDLSRLPSSSPMALQLTRPAQGSVAFEVRALKTRLTLAAAALPEIARPAFEQSTTESAARILGSLEAGRIDDGEARRALFMLQELAGVLLAMHAGTVTVTPNDAVASSSDMRSVDVRATTGDVLRVSVRAAGGASGEARVKLERVVDDGATVPESDRMMVRFDLAGSRGDTPTQGTHAAVDVQFGNERFDPQNPSYERLNKRIHGVLLDDQGQPIVNRGGKTVADHHFTEGVPDVLHDPAGFAAFAESFLTSLAPTDTDVAVADGEDDA